MNKIDGLNFGETIYCIEQDIEEYIQHNNLEEDKELNAILTEVEVLKKFKEIHDKQLQQLKVENEELRARNGRGMLAFLEEDFKKEQKIKKYQKCLDEIEKIANDNSFPSDFDVYEERDFYFNQLCKIDDILQKIKEVKQYDNRTNSDKYNM